GTAGPGGTFGRIYARTELNDSDQVLFKAQVDVGGGVLVDKLIRWTPPSTYTVIVSVGDSVGAPPQNVANIGSYADINASGQVVFQADLDPDGNFPQGYYFYDGSTITQIFFDPNAGDPSMDNFLASEMVMLNDAGTVAYTTGAFKPESTEEGSELDE